MSNDQPTANEGLSRPDTWQAGDQVTQTTEAEPLLATVDRSWSQSPLKINDDGVLWETKWHKTRPEDRALAACSRRIILNPEDMTPQSRVPEQLICRRCLREGSKA